MSLSLRFSKTLDIARVEKLNIKNIFLSEKGSIHIPYLFNSFHLNINLWKVCNIT